MCVPLQLNSIGLKIATGDIVNIHLVESILRHMSIEENQGKGVERHDGKVVKSRGHRIHDKRLGDGQSDVENFPGHDADDT